ncbi:hypothetical protein R3P38DRAFT_3234218 [Favolaschia claudopus]|uniref:Uncharacterized protein n=1 Tax=Favolaschia claudopus TaxID=2862362 RepID=A0AAV9ZHS2_9AGAR
MSWFLRLSEAFADDSGGYQATCDTDGETVPMTTPKPSSDYPDDSMSISCPSGPFTSSEGPVIPPEDESDNEFPETIPLPQSPSPETGLKRRQDSEYYDRSDEEDDTDSELDPSSPRCRRRTKAPNPNSSWARQKQATIASREPTFVPQHSRLDHFRSKILEDDPKAEFDDDNVLRVRCSHCAEWVVMQTLYEKQWSFDTVIILARFQKPCRQIHTSSTTTPVIPTSVSWSYA